MGMTYFSDSSPPLAIPAAQFVVCLFDGESELTVMPNLRFISARYDEGMPGQATLRYVFDRGGAIDVNREWPSSPEEVTGPDAIGPYVVRPDDRLCVYWIDPDDPTPQLIFDGFAVIPAATITSGASRAEGAILLQGTPIREWDEPILSRKQRDASTPDDKSNDTHVGLPVVFNPKGPRGVDGLGNATRDGSDGESDNGNFQYPIFLDEIWCRDHYTPPPPPPPPGFVGPPAPDPDNPFRDWTLPMCVKYILGENNPDEKYIKNPNFDDLDDLLDAREPISGQYYDPNDGTSYKGRVIVVKETELKGEAWPEALDRMLRRYGFRMCFAFGQDDNFLPRWRLDIYRVQEDDPASHKEIMIQDGGQLDPSLTNVSDFHIAREGTDVANQYTVETDLPEYEVALVLAPGFVPDPADATSASTIKNFDLQGPNWAGNEMKYRLYVFDECGEGHYNFGLGGDLTKGKAPDLTGILGGDDDDPDNYCVRRRTGSSSLLTQVGSDGLMAQAPALLLISWDYKGHYPALWDGSGTWYPVSKTWKMLDDRLGIYIDSKNPESWAVGNDKISFGVNRKSGGGHVKGISAQAIAGETHFTLMLATVIRGDQVLKATAKRRDASPTEFVIERLIDARERYKYQVITAHSWYNKTDKDKVIRDDTQAAKDDAIARRAAHEMPKISGPIVIPRITMAYQISDRITEIVGKNISMRTNAGDSGGEGPTYPRVVSLEWIADGRQATILHCEDDRTTNVRFHARRR